ncbi:MAG: hypothetical protein LBD45_09185 [Bacteroidales bacterium]|jgi:hypothetical protein|nr:hypothetical protein [Bacteroidales bacterium]
MNFRWRLGTFIFTFAFLLLGNSCSNKEKDAQQRLSLAKEYLQQGRYEAARLQIDSLMLIYAGLPEVLRESNKLFWEIEAGEQKLVLNRCDSLLSINQVIADSLKKILCFEKDETYQTAGIYFDKNQRLEIMTKTHGLRFLVNENGDMSVVGVASGQGKGTFSAIKAEVVSGIYSETPALSKNDSNNFNGEISQTIYFTRGRDNGFIEFLYTYKDEPLKITFLGSSKPFSFLLSSTEKKAMDGVYTLAVAQTNLHQFLKEKALAQKKIEFTIQAIEKCN